MQKRNLVSILPAAAVLALAGCGSDSAVINNLKVQAFPVDSTLTYEQALDRRQACSSASWSVSDDSRGREVVRYACELRGIEEFNEYFGGVRSSQGDVELVSKAVHSIEWFHNNGGV